MTKTLIAVLALGAAMAAAQDNSRRDAAVALARKTLAAKLGVSADSLQLDKAEDMDWPDTSLGCPQKGEMYGQMLMSGYRVTFKADGKTHAVHTAGERAVVCDAARPPVRPKPKS